MRFVRSLCRNLPSDLHLGRFALLVFSYCLPLAVLSGLLKVTFVLPPYKSGYDFVSSIILGGSWMLVARNVLWRFERGHHGWLRSGQNLSIPETRDSASDPY